jgi:hypothetical protein
MKRFPSIKTIMTRLNVDNDKAQLIRKIMQSDNPHLLDNWKQSRTYLQEPLIDYELIHPNTIMKAKMMALDEILDGHGTEVIHSSNQWINHYYQDIIATYINMGDTYIPTIILMHDDHRFIVDSWGNIVESLEKRGFKFD